MLSTLQEYGVRCLMEIARHPVGEPVTARQIAASEGLSVDYVEKILSLLRRAALVESLRGVHGGFTLAKPAQVMTVYEIFVALGGSLYDASFCGKFPGLEVTCIHINDCGVRPLWSLLARELERVLRQTTLAQLLPSEARVSVALEHRSHTRV